MHELLAPRIDFSLLLEYRFGLLYGRFGLLDRSFGLGNGRARLRDARLLIAAVQPGEECPGLHAVPVIRFELDERTSGFKAILDRSLSFDRTETKDLNRYIGLGSGNIDLDGPHCPIGARQRSDQSNCPERTNPY